MSEEITFENKDAIIENLRQRLEAANNKIAIYEQNGLAKLYYALNRKMNEAADMLNDNPLQNVDLDDKNNKSFERIVKILEASEKMAASVDTLGKLAKVTGDENKDVERKPFVDTIAEKRD